MVEIQYEHDGILAVGALAANDAISADTKIDATRLQGFRIAKLRMAASMTLKTTAEGPLIWGIACNMVAAQVESAIEIDPQSIAGTTQKAPGAWLKILGQIPFDFTNGPILGSNGVSAEMVEIMVNWSVIEGQPFVVWVYNQGSGGMTTGAQLLYTMEIFGVWLRD